VVQHPSAFNACSHTCHPFPESFKDFPIKSLIESLSWWHKFLVDDPRYVHLYLPELFLESEMFRTKVVQKIKAQVYE